MDHREVEDRNIAERYLRQELTPAEETAFEEHLVQCKKCREHLHMLESLMENIEDYQRDQFREGKVSGLETEHRIGIYRSWFFRIAAGIAILTGIAGISILIINKSRENITISQMQKDTTGQAVTEYASDIYVSTDSVSEISETGKPERTTALIAGNFIPNPFYENLTENYYRDAEIRITSPLKDTLYSNPVFAWEDKTNRILMLIIYNNQEEQVFKEAIENGFKLTIKLLPGLYYWQLQDQDETLLTRKFVFLPATVR